MIAAGLYNCLSPLSWPPHTPFRLSRMLAIMSDHATEGGASPSNADGPPKEKEHRKDLKRKVETLTTASPSFRFSKLFNSFVYD